MIFTFIYLRSHSKLINLHTVNEISILYTWIYPKIYISNTYPYFGLEYEVFNCICLTNL